MRKRNRASQKAGNADTLRELFAQHKLSKRVRLGVANQRIVIRAIDLPPLTDAKEITSAIRFQAEDHIPMPLEQAVLEHQVLGPVETPDGARTRSSGRGRPPGHD